MELAQDGETPLAPNPCDPVDESNGPARGILVPATHRQSLVAKPVLQEQVVPQPNPVAIGQPPARARQKPRENKMFAHVRVELELEERDRAAGAHARAEQ